MSRFVTWSRNTAVWIFIAILSYLLILTVLFSPQFSPAGRVGPTGILRGDQVVLPILVALILLSHIKGVQILVNRISLGLFLLTATITTTLVLNTLFFSLEPRVGDLFDILIWSTYTLAFIMISGNLPVEIAKRSFRLLLGLATLVALLAFLQSAGNQFALESLRPIYTERSIYNVRLSPTATTANPNTLAKLSLIPLFAFFALCYRSLIGNKERQNVIHTFLFGCLALMFFSIIIISDARSTLVGGIAGFGMIGAALLFNQVGNHNRRKWFLVVTTIIMTTILYVSIFVFEIGRISAFERILQDDSLQSRFTKWKKVLPLIFDRPLVGHGPSKQFTESLSFEHIDSGILSWWYHYGLAGVIFYLYFVLGAIRAGIDGLRDKELFQDQPVLWCASVAVLGWFSGTLVSWIFVALPQDRRVFTFALIVAAFITIRNDRKTCSENTTE